MQAPEKIFYKEINDPKEVLLLYRQHHDNNYDRIKERIIKKAILKSHKGNWKNFQILDVGAGGGIFTKFFLNLGANVTALDNSTVVIEANRLDNPGAEFVCADASAIKLDKKFDFIFAKDIIEHIQDDDCFLKNISDKIKDGGFVLVNTQNSFSFNYLVEKIYNLLIGNRNWMGWNPDHIRFYNYWTLKNKLQKNNLVPVKWFGSYYFPYRGFAHFLGKWGEHLEWRIFRIIEILNLYGVWPFNILGWNIGVLAKKENKFENQFFFEKRKWLQDMDFLNWCRHFFIIKEVLNLKSENILEIGSGNGVVKNCLMPITLDYKVMDVNKELNPDYIGDIRNFDPVLEKKFDCVIVADVLEHIPYVELEKALKNIFLYLKEDGRAIITIPHRADYFLFMFPINIPHIFRMPSKFLSPVVIIRRILRKNWIDFYHCWEIGIGGIKKKNVENTMKKSGFKIEKSKVLPYVDFWVLVKNN